MKKLTEDEYNKILEKSWEQVKKNGFLRIGQALYLNLFENNKELAKSIDGTDSDPFYATSISDERVKRFKNSIIQTNEK